ncbi:hypothetical protein ACYCJX_04045, partial [Staphylococcus borealis]
GVGQNSFKFVVHSQLALFVEFLYEILFAGPRPQLALLVEFLDEILFVGAPPARMTRTEKSLI